MPWNIRKIMIRKYFRRNTKKRLSIIPQDSTDPIPPCENLLSSTQHGSDINLNRTPNFNENQNPYLTYFYKPTDRPTILTSEFLPASSNHSIE
jgi:hypothetical protein